MDIDIYRKPPDFSAVTGWYSQGLQCTCYFLIDSGSLDFLPESVRSSRAPLQSVDLLDLSSNPKADEHAALTTESCDLVILLTSVSNT